MTTRVNDNIGDVVTLTVPFDCVGLLYETLADELVKTVQDINNKTNKDTELETRLQQLDYICSQLFKHQNNNK